MLVNQNRVLLVIIAVAVGCLVNMPQMKLKDPMMKAGVFAVCLYVAYWFLNSQGLVEALSKDTRCPSKTKPKTYYNPKTKTYHNAPVGMEEIPNDTTQETFFDWNTPWRGWAEWTSSHGGCAGHGCPPNEKDTGRCGSRPWSGGKRSGLCWDGGKCWKAKNPGASCGSGWRGAACRAGDKGA